MSKLVIVVPARRHRCGRALLLGDDGATRLGPFRVLATASKWAAKKHGNEARDWRKRFGHPPTGTYVVGGSLPPGMTPRPRRIRRFGALGALVLVPVAGDALEALRDGRKRFLLHGGPTDRRGRLRPTFGGFRVSDRQLAARFTAMNEANAALDPVSTVEVVETTPRPPWTDDGPRDRAGRLRPSFAPRRGRKRAGLSLKHATLMALGFGIAGKGVKLEATPGRRGFVGLALLTLGALGATACGPDDTGSDFPTPLGDGRTGASPTANPPDAGNEGGAEDDAGAGDEAGAGGCMGDDGGGPDGGYASGDDGGSGGTAGGGDDGTGSGDDGSGDDGTGDDGSGGAG